MRHLVYLIWAFVLSVIPGFAQFIPVHDVQFTTEPSGDSPRVGEVVNTGGLVTGIFFEGQAIRYFVADRAGGLWSGILVSDNLDRQLSVGDSIRFSAQVQEASGQTRLRNIVANSFERVPAAGTVPPFVTTTTSIAEPLEGVLVELNNAAVISINSNDTSFVVDDGSGPTTIGRGWDFVYYPQIGDSLRLVRGVVSSVNGAFFVNPRSDTDLGFFGNRPPAFLSVQNFPTNPTSFESDTVVAAIFDDEFVVGAEILYRFGELGEYVSTPLVDDGNHRDGGPGDGVWGGIIPPGPAQVTCYYYVRATDNVGASATSPANAPALTYRYLIRSLTSIADIYNHFDSYQDSTVNLRGVVTHMQDVTTSTGSRRISAYMQDERGRGFSLSQSGPASQYGKIRRGNLIEITGKASEFGGTIQLNDWNEGTTQLLAQNVELPAPLEMRTGDYRLQREVVRTSHNGFYGAGTWVQVSGTIFRVDQNVGGGTNIQFDDGSGNIIIRVWDAMNLDSVELNGRWFRIGDLVGVTCTMAGVSSTFNGDFQMLGGYAEDFTTGLPDVLPSEPLVLNIASRPFAPDLGQTVEIFVNAPAAGERRLRVYDLRGRLVKTLLSSLSGGPALIEWDGKTDLNDIVPIGTYILHFESVKEGKSESVTKPIVVGTKL
jgi:hypothetical protein